MHLIPQEAQVIVVRALVLSRLDYVNVFYLGIPEYLIQRLQVVQNIVVRLLYKLPKHAPITLFREKLH